MKPFPPSSTLSSAEKMFNYRLPRAPVVSENAFGQLKAGY